MSERGSHRKKHSGPRCARRTAALVLSLLLLASARPAVAASPSDAEAKAHFKRGTEAYRRAAYKEAIQEFETANRLRPHGILFFNIAQAQEKLGDLAAALRNFREYLRALPNAEDRPVVEQAMVNLENRLGERGVQQLAVYTQPSGARVQVDARAAAQSPYSVELPFGRHALTVTLEGFETIKREIDIPPDRSLQLDITLARAEPEAESEVATADIAPAASLPAPPLGANPAPVAAPPAAVVATPERSHFELPTATWVSAGVAGSALAGAVVLGLLAKSAHSTLISSVHDHDAAQGLRDQVESRSLGANVLFVTAGAAAITGLVFYLLEPRTVSGEGD